MEHPLQDRDELLPQVEECSTQQKELNMNMKLCIYQSVTNGYELWVVTKIMRMSSVRRVAVLSFKGRVRSSKNSRYSSILKSAS